MKRQLRAMGGLLFRRLRHQFDKFRLARLYTGLHTNFDSNLHLRTATEWLCRAQDAGPDRGVSYGVRFGGNFQASYPEATGYIICTFLDLADVYRDPMFVERALQMGQWEIDVQMPCGAVMGGKMNSNPTPAIFNTGLVLLGWAALYKRTLDKKFLRAGRRAAQWLVETQESNGCWVRGNSVFADPRITTYNVKAAFGLAGFAEVTGDDAALAAAIRNAEYTTAKQLPNGWFADCCITEANRPLLHTIAYTMQGLLGIGQITGCKDFIDATTRTADSLLNLMDEKGFIPGRIDQNMAGIVDWACLTGIAQTSIVWSQLFRLSGERKYAEAVTRANRYLMARHDITSADLAIRGGLAGSWPVWAPYGRLMVLSWATKFLVEALLAEQANSVSASVRVPSVDGRRIAVSKSVRLESANQRSGNNFRGSDQAR